MIPIGDVPLRPVTQTNIPPGVVYRTWTPTRDEEEDILNLRRQALPGVPGIPATPMWSSEDWSAFWGGVVPGLPWELQRQQASAKAQVQTPTTGPAPTMANVRLASETVTANASGSPDERGTQVAPKPKDITQYPYLNNLAKGGSGDTGPFERNAWLRRDVETPNGMWIYSEWEPGKIGYKFFPKASQTKTAGSYAGGYYPRYYGGGGGGGGGYNAPQRPWFMDLMTWKIG